MNGKLVPKSVSDQHPKYTKRRKQFNGKVTRKNVNGDQFYGNPTKVSPIVSVAEIRSVSTPGNLTSIS